MKFTSSIIVLTAAFVLSSTIVFADGGHKKKSVQEVTAQECEKPNASNVKACKALKKASDSHSKKASHSHSTDDKSKSHSD